MIIANLATFPARERNWHRVLTSIAHQVDRVNVIFNEASAVPEIVAEFPNVHGIVPTNDLKDTGKFFPEVSKDDWVFTIDDDIIYPPDYVRRSIAALNETKLGLAVGGYHGSIYQKPRYLKSRFLQGLIKGDGNYIVNRRRIFGFSFAQDASIIVDQLGTGATFMTGEAYPAFSKVAFGQRFIDVAAAKYWFDEGIPLVCLKRPENWIQAMSAEDSVESINETFTRKAPKAVADIIHQFAYKNARTGQAV